MIKKIKDSEIYYVSNEGEIFSKYKTGCRGEVQKKLTKLKHSMTRSGYKMVHLYENGKRRSLVVHRIVAQNFLKDVHGCNTVNHKDLDKLNNNIENLEWTTPMGNYLHAKENGAFSKPPIITKVDLEKIMTIRTFNNSKMDAVFAKMYGMDKSSICNIRNYRSFKDV